MKKTLPERNRPQYANVSPNQIYVPEFKSFSLLTKLIFIILLIGLRMRFIACSAFTDVYPVKIKRILQAFSIEEIQQSLQELTDCGRITYDSSTGDLHVTDYWIFNLYACNPNTIIGYENQLRMLGLTSENIINLARNDIEKSRERLLAKEKNSAYFVKVYSDVIWSKAFSELSPYEQLTYLVLYIGLEKGYIATGYYASINEYDIVATVGDNIDPEEIANALSSLHKNDFIYYAPKTHDVYVCNFTISNYYATGYDQIVTFKENLNRSRLKDFFVKDWVEYDIESAETTLFNNYPNIKKLMMTKGYKSVDSETGVTFLYTLHSDGKVYKTVADDSSIPNIEDKSDISDTGSTIVFSSKEE